MQLDFELRYFDCSQHVKHWPYVLRLDCFNPQHRAMIKTEFAHLKVKIRELGIPMDNWDYSGDPSFFVSFKNKSDAMLVKLMWKPKEWTSVSGFGW